MPKRVRPSVLVARLHRRQVTAADELRDRLKDAQKRIAADIQAAAQRRGITVDKRVRDELDEQLTARYRALNSGIDTWLRELTEKTALEWHQVAVADLRDNGRGGLSTAFSRDRVRRYWEILHPDNTKSLAAVFTDQMQASDKRLLRQAFLDTFRQQTLEGLTAKETAKLLQDRWDGLAANLRSDRFVDAAGHPWTNAQYIQMLTRTTLQRTSHESYTDTLLENGFDLVRISDDGDPCPLCRAWAGVIVSLTGRTKGYPTIKEARDAGWGHPNCLCRYDYVDAAVDRAEIERQRNQPTPRPPKVEPDAPEYSERMRDYVSRVQTYNDEIRIKGKVAEGMTKAAAVVDLKRDKLAVQTRAAFPAEDRTAWVDEIPRELLEAIELDAVPRIQPAKKGDEPNSARNSALGGVLTLARDGSVEAYIEALRALVERRRSA